MDKFITLAHGSGGRQTSELIASIFKKHFANELFTPDDAAVLPLAADRIAMSTDGFVVSPWRFAGGNIGKLSICGTVNDIACMGAVPKYITCAFIIEEGFPVADLEEIAEAMAKTAAEAGVKIVAGDTKVVGKGQVDKVFITTAGVGELIKDVKTSGALAQVGDAVIVSGDVGRHGCTILLERDEFGIEADVTSDCAPLGKTVEAVLSVCKEVHVIRDATRGGVGTVLYEICDQSQVGINIKSENIPVADPVKGVCGMLGLDPLYLACEGRLVIFAPKSAADDIVKVLQSMPYSSNAAVIGEVTDNTGKVTVEQPFGGKTILPQPTGELLPRIC
ncbi:MAG: hydrogenase expression/formation protein HypE [Lentisphaeria bacterium]|nr:hydrogenase expression/formation protein HypE [Lentisphaeria bacterium]